MEGTLAEIRLFAGDFAPRHWAFCDGQLLDVSNNTALFSLLGDHFGGDAWSTFALPNLDDLPQPYGHNVRYIICVKGGFPARP